ncbi:MAG: hypothetical protein RIF41_36435 [Polyangiaceae bacterium]
MTSLHGETWTWVEGVVAPLDGALAGPVSEVACVAYDVWGYRVLSGQPLDARRTSFVLERGVERFVVRLDELALERDKLASTRFWTTGRARSTAALAFLERHGLAGGASKVMQVVEWTVPLGATVRVWGRTRVLVDPSGDDAGYRAPPRRPVLQARKLEVVSG